MKTCSILSSVKSRYFMLVVCATLLLGATACSNEEFGIEVPEVKKEWTKQELIEQALSRIPQTRSAHSNMPIEMITVNKTVTFKFLAVENMEIHWGDETPYTITRGGEISHSYSDNLPSHAIRINGSAEKIVTLEISDNGLIYLDLYTPKLYYLDCSNNYLDSLHVNSCPGLSTIKAQNNDLVFIDVTQASKLLALQINNNRLRKIDVSNNPDLTTLEIKNNRIADIDLTNNIDLFHLAIGNQPIATINDCPINDTSFSIFPTLITLDISGIPLQALDLSKNPKVKELNISETDITQLDVLDLQIESLRASYSRLTNLLCDRESLKNLYDLRIERTPFENNAGYIKNLVTILPFRNLPDQYGTVIQGVLYTYSQHISKSDASYLFDHNWIINP